MRPVRIANCSGFFGDRMSALAEVAGEPGIDVITGDYLAEVTMLVLAKSRAKHPDGGYASTFLRQLEPALDRIADAGIKVVSNAGGLNPHGLATALREMIASAGHSLSVAVVDGDDLIGDLDRLAAEGHRLEHLETGQPLASWPHEPLTVNAYLGGWGIAAALAGGADIVVTGRVTDASLVVGPAAWWHGWSRTDFDALAGAVVAGHLVECGTQVTGGNYSNFTALMPLGVPSFPIAEVASDGSSVMTKGAGGGAVTVGTATAQLMYEIGPPEYLNPDVAARFDTVQFGQLATDRVSVTSVRGQPPPPTTKVAITALGGHRNHYTTIITGLDREAKAAWFEAAVRDAAGSIRGIESIWFERLGSIADDPQSQGEASMLIRTTVTGDERSVGRPFGAAIVELALANIPGFYGLSLPGAAGSFGTYWPGLIDQVAVPHRVTMPDGQVVTIEPTPSSVAITPPSTDRAATAAAATDDHVAADEPTQVAPLGLVADARSGDKGGDANVGVWVREPAHWTWLRDALTVAQFRHLVPETDGLAVDRYEFANVFGLNFVVHGLLGEGATANHRSDNQAKALGEYLRARHLPIPVHFLAT